MSFTIYIIIFGVFSLISIFVYFIRVANVQDEVKSVNDKVEEENDEFTKLMLKIIDHDSFRILGNYDKFQIITFDACLFEFGDVDWTNLSKNKLQKFGKFCNFLIKENKQHALVSIEGGYILIQEQSNGMISNAFLPENKLKGYLKLDIKRLSKVRH